MVKGFGNTFCVSLQDSPKNISQFLIYYFNWSKLFYFFYCSCSARFL